MIEPEVAAERDLLDSTEAGVRALRGGALRSAGYAVGILLALVSAPLLIRHLGVTTFGKYVTATAIITIVAGLTEGGLNAVVLRGYATLRGRERDQLMRNALGARLTLSVVGVCGAIAFTAVAGYGSTLVLGVTLAGVGLVFQLLQSVLSVPLQSELRLGWATLADLIRQFVPSISQRQIIVLHIESLQTSCGFGVPRMRSLEERPDLQHWAEKKGEHGLREYRANKNATSIDGLPTGLADNL